MFPPTARRLYFAITGTLHTHISRAYSIAIIYLSLEEIRAFFLPNVLFFFLANYCAQEPGISSSMQTPGNYAIQRSAEAPRSSTAGLGAIPSTGVEKTSRGTEDPAKANSQGQPPMVC